MKRILLYLLYTINIPSTNVENTRTRKNYLREKKKKKKNTVRLNISTTKDRGVSPRLVINVSFLERAWNRKKKRSAFVVCSTKQSVISFLHDFHPFFFFFFPLPLPLFHDDPFHSYAPRGRMCPVLELCKVALSSAASYVSWLDF